MWESVLNIIDETFVKYVGGALYKIYYKFITNIVGKFRAIHPADYIYNFMCDFTYLSNNVQKQKQSKLELYLCFEKKFKNRHS